MNVSFRLLFFAVSLVLSTVSAFSQTAVVDGTTSQYTWQKNQHTASATTDALTIKQAPTNQRGVKIHSMLVTCSSACLITIEHSGTVATTTCTTVASTQAGSSISFLTQACTTSNAGSGTEIGHGRLFGAGTFPFTGQFIKLERYSAHQITIRVTQGSAGTIDYLVIGEEVN